MASKPTSRLKSAHGPTSHNRPECTHPHTSDSVKFCETGDGNDDKWATSEQGFPHGSCVSICRHTTAEKGQQWMKMCAHKHTHMHAEQGNGNTNRSEKQPEKAHTLGNANCNCGATLSLRLRDIPNRRLLPHTHKTNAGGEPVTLKHCALSLDALYTQLASITVASRLHVARQFQVAPPKASSSRTPDHKEYSPLVTVAPIHSHNNNKQNNKH